MAPFWDSHSEKNFSSTLYASIARAVYIGRELAVREEKLEVLDSALYEILLLVHRSNTSLS